MTQKYFSQYPKLELEGLGGFNYRINNPAVKPFIALMVRVAGSGIQ